MLITKTSDCTICYICILSRALLTLHEVVLCFFLCRWILQWLIISASENFFPQCSARDLPTQQEDGYSVRFPEQLKQKREYVICISEWDFMEILYEEIYENKELKSFLPLKRTCVTLLLHSLFLRKKAQLKKLTFSQHKTWLNTSQFCVNIFLVTFSGKNPLKSLFLVLLCRGQFVMEWCT